MPDDTESEPLAVRRRRLGRRATNQTMTGRIRAVCLSHCGQTLPARRKVASRICRPCASGWQATLRQCRLAPKVRPSGSMSQVPMARPRTAIATRSLPALPLGGRARDRRVRPQLVQPQRQLAPRRPRSLGRAGRLPRAAALGDGEKRQRRGSRRMLHSLRERLLPASRSRSRSSIRSSRRSISLSTHRTRGRLRNTCRHSSRWRSRRQRMKRSRL
mmetsp:Transcript_39511/g.113676  ORF Transcript_39511/g.113676 Transcript_39511/m.113676 type:complete len:216 (+) Transcript_39511:145-792(+)